MRSQGGAEEAGEGALAAAEAMAVAGVDTAAARMGSTAAALVILVRLAPVPMDIHQAAMEASTNLPIPEILTTTISCLRLRNITSTSRLRIPEVPTGAAQAVRATSNRTTTSTTQTSKLRSRPSTTKRILFSRTTKRPKSR